MFKDPSKQDFSVGAYQCFDSQGSRSSGALANAARALGHVAARAMRRLLEAIYESSCRQALGYRHMTLEARASGKCGGAREARIDSSCTDTVSGQAACSESLAAREFHDKGPASRRCSASERPLIYGN